MGFSGYFLIVADFIQWSKQQGIPVGPGRGSGAGSVAAWALTITDLYRHNSTCCSSGSSVLNACRRRIFDIDFCQEGRDRVIDHVGNNTAATALRKSSHSENYRPERRFATSPGAGLPSAMSTRVAELIRTTPPNPSRLKQALDGEPRLRPCATPTKSIAQPAGNRPADRGSVSPRLDPRRGRGDRRPAAGGTRAA